MLQQHSCEFCLMLLLLLLSLLLSKLSLASSSNSARTHGPSRHKRSCGCWPRQRQIGGIKSSQQLCQRARQQR